jgi:hypothetical protein
MKWTLAVVFLCLISCARPAKAYMNGNDLHNYCSAALDKQSQAGSRAGLCLGFLDAYRQLAVMLPVSANFKLCLPEGVGQEQLIKVLVKYLDRHPEELHLPAAQLVYDATTEAFPCPAAAK